MLDILGNIDTANYFIQDALFNTVQQGLEVRHNVYQGDGYFVDIVEARKNTFNVNITTLGRQNIARILVSKDEIVLRYSAKFMLTYKKKTDMFSTNLFDEPFDLDDIEATFFTQSTMVKYTDVQFSADVMSETLQMIKVLFYAFEQFREERNKVNNHR
ncbi:hypothetical protein VWJ57_05250 [Escherichia coli O157]|uniref:hypothetical protein n=1 Tax=Escherichia coli TaxID=562 RepID=UPI0011658CD9|nr:hypothetical protein [Escherichia coli]MED6536319.1 hypothetical protein [Escherichia coli O157]QDF14029.1 hypothetical protein vBEcoMphAPEC6_gp406c [Escherichia phage vB_EcoM_phAPEC6]MCU6294526.1 hypothetical protein [Escherichia coli]MCV8618548.1 hypothetical protein [Escherichia coli]MDI0694868.1 hypothetical protein [Escherichia coli]